MTRQTRRLLFLGFALVFFAVSPFIIRYAQGYRFDIKTLNFTRTGALFLKVRPVKATLLLDKKLTRETGILGGSIFIRDLLPKPYNLEVTKDGYQPWRKTIEVEPELVTEARHIILFKNSYEVFSTTTPPLSSGLFSTSTRAILKATSTDGNKLLLRNRNELTVEFLEDIDEQPFRKKGEREVIVRFSEAITDAVWHDGSEHVFFAVGGHIKVAELDARGGRNIHDLAKAENARLSWSKKDRRLSFTDGGVLKWIQLE